MNFHVSTASTKFIYVYIDQEFVALFKKRTKVVRAKPEDYMRMYSIPINSAIKFIPLYEEDSRFDKASWEGDFDNVADLHKLDKLPKVSKNPL